MDSKKLTVAVVVLGALLLVAAPVWAAESAADVCEVAPAGSQMVSPVQVASNGPLAVHFPLLDVVQLRGGSVGASTDNTWTGNNTFTDSKFFLKDNLDPTKVAQFQLSGISAGTTRTYTLPDVSGTLFANTATNTQNNDLNLNFGTAGTRGAYLRLSTSNVTGGIPGALEIALDSNAASANFFQVIAQGGNFNYGHGHQTDPTLFIHSHNQSTTQWLGLAHDGTSGIISTGTSTNIGFAPAAGGTIATFGTQSNFAMGSAGRIGWSSNTDPTTAADDLKLYRDAAATLQMGADVNGSAVAQTLKAHDGITGSNIAGAALTLSSGIGTGSAAGASTNLGRTLMTGSGTGVQTRTQGLTVCESKTLSNTTGTATAIVNITLPNNSSGAGRATISVQCNDGTNFDSAIVETTQAFVNKAGTLTFGTALTETSPAANNSGSCTIVPTWVANGTTSVDLKVTPVITTIAPSTTTAYVNYQNLGPGTVTCQ